jgi:3-hydroxy-9,10-secoandrosta-1,3,5(10)-triene-9,17-dione monooxygenase reductase component
MVSVCIDLNSSALPALQRASHFAVNVLAASQQAISARFAGAADERFDGIDWSAGVSGAPLLKGVLASFECRRNSSIEVGDHVVLFGEVESTETFSGEPLLYFNSRYGRMAS